MSSSVVSASCSSCSLTESHFQHRLVALLRTALLFAPTEPDCLPGGRIDAGVPALRILLVGQVIAASGGSQMHVRRPTPRGPMPIRGSARTGLERTAIRCPSIVVIYSLSNPAGAGKESRWNAVARLFAEPGRAMSPSVDALADQAIVKVICFVDHAWW